MEAGMKLEALPKLDAAIWANECLFSAGIEANPPENYGEHVIITRAPYDKRLNLAQYQFNVLYSGTYGIYIEYKAMEQRKCDLVCGEWPKESAGSDRSKRVIFLNASNNPGKMQNTTGDWHFKDHPPQGVRPDWDNKNLRWSLEWLIDLRSDCLYGLEISADRAPFPHIRAIGVMKQG
jgi:hypothetical protein